MVFQLCIVFLIGMPKIKYCVCIFKKYISCIVLTREFTVFNGYRYIKPGTVSVGVVEVQLLTRTSWILSSY